MIQKLIWDSTFFEFPIGEVVGLESNDLTNASDFDLLYLKSVNQVQLEIPGFVNSFSEAKITFAKSIKVENQYSQAVTEFDATKQNRESLYELAYESGTFSRFKLDQKFPAEKFKEMYQKWVDNSINKSFADGVLVFMENNEILGFVTYKHHLEIATIGLIAVSPNQQRKGIGQQLLAAVEKIAHEKQLKTLQIPTQESNQLACNFYAKSGYTINEILFIKHYWKK